MKIEDMELTEGRRKQPEYHSKKIKDNKISASIKPQQIHHLAEAFDGTGNELLDKYDERGITRELVKELGLQNFYFQIEHAL